MIVLRAVLPITCILVMLSVVLVSVVIVGVAAPRNVKVFVSKLETRRDEIAKTLIRLQGRVSMVSVMN
jgi:hypothetical protein